LIEYLKRFLGERKFVGIPGFELVTSYTESKMLTICLNQQTVRV
jgi:hypothetical protein